MGGNPSSYEFMESDEMARIEKSIEINAPPEEIWKMLYWNRIPEWLDIIKNAEYTSKERDTVGATAHVVGEAAGIKVEWDVEITEYVKNKSAKWRTTGGNLTAIGESNLKVTEKGTQLIFIIDSELPYSILGKIIDKLVVNRESEKGIEKGLKKLKALLEK